MKDMHLSHIIEHTHLYVKREMNQSRRLQAMTSQQS
jgi:hypothetical protein